MGRLRELAPRLLDAAAGLLRDLREDVEVRASELVERAAPASQLDGEAALFSVGVSTLTTAVGQPPSSEVVDRARLDAFRSTAALFFGYAADVGEAATGGLGRSLVVSLAWRSSARDLIVDVERIRRAVERSPWAALELAARENVAGGDSRPVPFEGDDRMDLVRSAEDAQPTPERIDVVVSIRDDGVLLLNGAPVKGEKGRFLHVSRGPKPHRFAKAIMDLAEGRPTMLKPPAARQLNVCLYKAEAPFRVAVDGKAPKRPALVRVVPIPDRPEVRLVMRPAS